MSKSSRFPLIGIIWKVFLALALCYSLVWIAQMAYRGKWQQGFETTTAKIFVETNQAASSIACDEKSGTFEEAHQRHHSTGFDRYPDEYELAVKLSKSKDIKKILSFGCSTGREAVTLALKYFPNSSIYGVDIDDETIALAEKFAQNVMHKSGFTFFNGMRTPIRTYAPYDIIFANSVLCSFPVVGQKDCYIGRDVSNCSVSKFSTIYPFKTFEAAIARLDMALRVGGLLAIVNTNYKLTDTNVSHHYAEFGEEMCRGNFVPQANFESQRMERISQRPCLYEKLA